MIVYNYDADLEVSDTCVRSSLLSWVELSSNFSARYRYLYELPSVLWRCWLGSRKGIQPVNKLSGGVLAWLSDWSNEQTCILVWLSWCHCHSLSLASVKSRLVLPFWYRLTRIVPDKGLLNGCVCVCVPIFVRIFYLPHYSACSAESEWNLYKENV